MVGRLRQRIEANCLAHGLLYPWWVPVAGFAGQVTVVVIALLLRDALWTPEPITLALVLVLVSPFIQLGMGRWLPWYLDALGGVLTATWLMWLPPDYAQVPLDAAPGLLAFVTAETTARDGMRPGAIVGGLSVLLIVLANGGPGLVAAPVHLLDVLLGFVIGAMLLYQMRALAAERRAREQAWEQATAAERNRIAREIHDLVAHSLSVTLLHITGARHALRDVSGSGAGSGADAVDEVDAALSDAERVGRRAMADIRHTVSALADGPEPRRSLPSAADIAALVGELDAAGLGVEYAESGDPSGLPDAAGLGLYRIAQESLANVAKHAPGSTARVRLSCARGSARLTVSNRLAGATARRTPDGVGSGLAGMHARAEQLGATLTAGPVGEDWVVDLRLGSASRGVELPCGRTVGGAAGSPSAAIGATT